MHHSKLLPVALLAAVCLVLPTMVHADEDTSTTTKTTTQTTTDDKKTEKPAEKAPPSEVTTQGSVDAGGQHGLDRGWKCGVRQRSGRHPPVAVA